MPAIYPFNAIQYAATGDVSSLVASPYDVLDEAAKQRLLAKNPRNIVGVDLPHTPAKELGPAAAYTGAGGHFRAMLANGTLAQSSKSAMFAYRQTWTQADPANPGKLKAISRSGLACCVEAVPFGPRPGGGILPHEETFSGPKEDRLALMKATKAQLSPIFSLHADERGQANLRLGRVMSSRPADQTARTDDGTLHECWAVTDVPTIAAFMVALAGADIFIADGHHRYNTALNYLKHLESLGPVPQNHPARRVMMVLVGMSDPGLVIWPTHRVLGGMKDYTYDRFVAEASKFIAVHPLPGRSLHDLGHTLSTADLESRYGRNVFGLFDFQTKQAAVASPIDQDPLAARFPDKARDWRDLTVAFIQHVLVEQVCQPRLNGGRPVTWSFPHTIKEVEEMGSGAQATPAGGPQLAILVQPTRLSAVRDVSRAGQLMPQKSTFFYPKLATGFFISPLE